MLPPGDYAERVGLVDLGSAKYSQNVKGVTSCRNIAHRSTMPKFNSPENFDFSRPAKWPEWKDQFYMFRIATKLDKEEQIVQISSVVYAMGREAHAMYW